MESRDSAPVQVYKTESGLGKGDNCPRCHDEELVLSHPVEGRERLYYCPNCRFQLPALLTDVTSKPSHHAPGLAAQNAEYEALELVRNKKVTLDNLLEPPSELDSKLRKGVDIRAEIGKEIEVLGLEKVQQASSSGVVIREQMAAYLNSPLWTSAQDTRQRHGFAPHSTGDEDPPHGPLGLLDVPESTNPSNEVHETGAVRSKDTNGFDFDLISPIAMMNAAGVMAEGAAKYGAGNYLKGFKISCLYNHLMMHLMMFMLGDETEDHLGHAQWNLNAMIHFMQTRKDLDDRQNYNLTAEQIAAIKETFRFAGK